MRNDLFISHLFSIFVHMKINDIKKHYIKFNVLFFNNTLVPVSKVKFVSNNENSSAGYMYQCKGTVYEGIYDFAIAFNKELIHKDSDVQSILLHEMIHIWQYNSIDFDKYDSDYSWESGHDRVFVSKMNSINMLCELYDYDIKVSLTYNK